MPSTREKPRGRKVKGSAHRESVGYRLQQCRLKIGMTAEQLSELSGVGRTAISHLETGKTQYGRADHVYNLAKALNVSTDWLIAKKYPKARK